MRHVGRDLQGLLLNHLGRTIWLVTFIFLVFFVGANRALLRVRALSRRVRLLIWIVEPISKLLVHLIEHCLVLSVLGFVLVEVHLLECLRGCMSLSINSGLFFLFLFYFFSRLNGLKFVENILIMQNRMGKLILKVINREKSLNPVLNNGIRQDLIDIGPLLRLNIQHSLKNTLNALAEVRGDVGVLAHDDFAG